MRLVLDTNVALSAVLGPSAPARLIEPAAEGELELFTSAELLAELAEVLAREDISRRLERQGRSAPEVLAHYEALVERIVPASIARTATDPDDDDVLQAALRRGPATDRIIAPHRSTCTIGAPEAELTLAPANADIRRQRGEIAAIRPNT